jgi:hypothetical protein
MQVNARECKRMQVIFKLFFLQASEMRNCMIKQFAILNHRAMFHINMFQEIMKALFSFWSSNPKGLQIHMITIYIRQVVS